jgi:O-antigen biosynthesis protein WbqP
MGLLLLLPLLITLFLFGLVDTGSPLFVQQRIGKGGVNFKLIKFRTMTKETPSLATHLIHRDSITPYGRLIRKVKLDELPQLWNVLMGDMSLVGPRPCLPSQKELINWRAHFGVLDVKPGLTGYSQALGVDMSNEERLARLDCEGIKKSSISFYFRILCLTFIFPLMKRID